MPGSNFEALKPSKQENRFGNVYANHPNAIDCKSTFGVCINFEEFKGQKQQFLMPESDFEAQKTIKTGQKEIWKYLRKKP